MNLEWREMIRRAQMIDQKIEKTARAIVTLGLESLSLNEEIALKRDHEFREAVMQRVKMLKKEEEIAEEKARQAREDEKILSKKRPILSFEQSNDLKFKREDMGLEKDAILVVDDIEADLDKITEFLSEMQLSIYGATNMEDALDIIRRKPISILITDIVLPMYRLTPKEYDDWVEQATTRHAILRLGRSTEYVKVVKTKIVKEETTDYSEFSGFKLLDEARKLLPWLPIIVISRYTDLEMARHAIGSQVQDIFSKQKHLESPEMLLKSVRNHIVPIHKRIADFGPERLKEFLNNASEQTITLKVLIPLFHKLGYRGIRYTHGTNECGLDLVFYDVDRLGKCRYMGAQVKAGNIHKSVGEHTSKNIITILQQVQQAFESTMYIPSEKKELELDRMFVISSKSITQPAREYIRKSLMGKVYSQHIEFWDAEAIVDFILSTQES